MFHFRGAPQACDASRIVMRHDTRGHVVAIGARTRTIPPALRRALHHRDRGCRFPGCGVRVAEGHHLHHWAQGGPRRSRTSRCSAADTTARCTRNAIRWRVRRTGRSSSGARMVAHYPRRRFLLECLEIRSQVSGRVMTPRACTSMRSRPDPAGSESAWTWAGRSTCCTRWRIRRASGQPFADALQPTITRSSVV